MSMSESNEASAADQENLERFTFLMSGLSDGIWDWDLETGKFYMSDRAFEMLGYKKGDLPEAFSTIIDLVHEDDLGDMLETWSSYMEGEIPSYVLQYRLRQADDTFVWIESRGISAREEGAEEPYRLAGYHRDITVRKNQERMIHEKQADINNMLHNMMQGVFTVIPDNIVHPEYSAHLEKILDSTDIAGRNVIDLLFGKSSMGSDTVDQVNVGLSAIIGEDSMSYDFNSHCLVEEVLIGEGDDLQIIHLDWIPIVDEEKDITEKVFRKEAKHQTKNKTKKHGERKSKTRKNKRAR